MKKIKYKIRRAFNSWVIHFFNLGLKSIDNEQFLKYVKTDILPDEDLNRFDYFNKGSKNFNKYVTDSYFKIAKENLLLDVRIIEVKKRKRKYDLAIFRTPEGETTFALGRQTDLKNNNIKPEDLKK